MRLAPPHTPMTKYIGMSIASQNTKNRNRSRLTKTPTIPVSRTSMAITNSFVRSSMACQAEASAIGMRSVVRSTRSRLMPSIPMWYDAPSDGIQATCSSNW